MVKWQQKNTDNQWNFSFSSRARGGCGNLQADFSIDLHTGRCLYPPGFSGWDRGCILSSFGDNDGRGTASFPGIGTNVYAFYGRVVRWGDVPKKSETAKCTRRHSIAIAHKDL